LNLILKTYKKKIFNGKFTNDTIWLLFSQAFIIFGGALITLLITRFMGLDMLGYFNQALAYYGILSIIFSLGLNNTLVKKISENELLDVTNNLIFSNALIQTFCQSLLLTISTIIFFFVFPGILSSFKLANSLWIVLVALPIYNLNKNFDAFYSGSRNQRMVSINRTIRWLLFCFLVFLVCITTKNIDYLFSTFFCSEFILLFFNIIVLRKEIVFNWNYDIVISNLKFGISTFPAEIVSVLLSNIDIIILGYFLSKYDLGFYSLMIFIGKTLLVFPTVISQNINPIVSRLWAENKKKELYAKLSHVFKINFLVSSLLIIAFIIALPFILEIFNVKYPDSYPYFYFVLFGVFVSSLFYWLGGVFIMVGMNRLNNQRTLFLFALTSLNILLLTNFFNVFGAYLAFMVNSISSTFVFYTLLNRLKYQTQ
jgi:stage V sporulation protein B